MPRVVASEGTARGLERCRKFLADNNPQASRRAGQIIDRHIALPVTTPEVGRPLSELPEIRELIIGFGDSGYVVLYRHEPQNDSVYVLAFRHQKEAGY